jgi:hypothetical protein
MNLVSDELFSAQNGAQAEEYLSIWRRLKARKIGALEVEQIVRDNTRDLAMRVWGKWDKGDLLQSQRLSFGLWLQMDERSWRVECHRASETLATFEVMGEMPKNFRRFVTSRVWAPGLAWRKKLVEMGEGDPDYRGSLRRWADENTRYDWTWTNA